MRTFALFPVAPVAAVAVIALATAACAAPADESVSSEDAALDAALEAEWGELDDDLDAIDDGERDDAAALSELEEAAVREDEGAGEVDVPPPAEAVATTESSAPCDAATSLDLPVYYEGFAGDLLTALSKRVARCTRVWLAVPKVAASAEVPDANLWPRPVRGAGVHAYGKQFHATAEVHWGSTTDAAGNRHPGWKTVEVVKEGPGRYLTRPIPRAKWFRTSWYLKGVLFRQRMAKRGFRTQDGDSWHVNELESVWARSRAYLAAVRDLARGLADGDPEYDAFADPDPEIAAKSAEEKEAINRSAHERGVRGVIYVSSLGRPIRGEKSDDGWMNALKQTLRRERFWASMADDVAIWGQERYPGYPRYCTGATLADQTSMLAAFEERLLDLAESAPRYRTGARKGQSTVATALFYLRHRHTPVLNAAWSDFSGDAKQPLGRVNDFVAAQVYAARTYDAANDIPARRVGLYFRPNAADVHSAANASFAEHTARVVTAAYQGANASAADACAASGCRCGQ